MSDQSKNAAVPGDKAQLAFRSLEPSHTITRGTPSIEVRGVLRSKDHVPTGNVVIKVEGAGVAARADIDREGSFCARLDTSGIHARKRPYPLSMRYQGAGGSTEVKHSDTTLIVKKASPRFTALQATPSSVTYGSAYITVSGVLGARCEHEGDPEVFPTGEYVTVKAPNTSIKDQACLVDSIGRFSANLATQGVPAGSYVVLCTYPGDDDFNPAPDGSIDFAVLQASPAFVRLDSPSIVYGQGPTAISGKIKSSAGVEIPGGSVKIGLGTESAWAPIDAASGDFRASSDTQFFAAGSAPIYYDYSGDRNFTGVASGQSQLLITPAAPRLSNLRSLSIDYGTPKTTLSGSIGSSSGRIPSGSVEITMAGGTQHGAIDPLTGAFQATFNSKALPSLGSPFVVTYHYPGDNNFTSATDNSTAVSFNAVQVTGRVLLAGNAVPNVRVRAFDSVHGGQVREDTTAPDGSFALTVPAGLPLHVEFPPTHTFPDGRKVFLTGANRNAVQPFTPLVLDAAYELRDALIQGATARKIAGSNKTEPLAGVKVYLEDPKTRAVVAHTVTDAQGAFAFSKVGQYVVRFDSQLRHGNDLLIAPISAQGVLAQSDHPSPPMEKVIYGPALSQVVGQVTDGVKGLEGITIEMETPPDLTVETKTDSLGYYSFQTSAPSCRLNFSALAHDSQGTSWELQPDQPSYQVFSLNPGETKAAATTKYLLERHTILWTVISQGVPVPNKLVEVRTADGKSVLQAKRTNDKGNAFFDVGQANDYAVWVYPDDRVAGGVMTQVVTVNSQNDGSTEIPAQVGGDFGPPHGGVKEAVIDIQSYPILTEEIPPGMTSTQSRSGGFWNSSSAPIGQIAQNAINEVLSWRSKSNDAKAFVSALTQAFDLKEVEGHTQWSWTPRSYTVQTDMGAVTGAQASIYNRATVALNQSLPLLDGLYPLLPTIPPEDLNSIRDVARSQYTSLVNEFGVVGGPRPPRVDQLFTLLLGDPGVTNPENLVSGTLHELRDRFGLRRQYVTTIAHEQNLTNFLILADYVIGLAQSWTNEKAFFVRNGGGGVEPYFGTQLVLLSRGLDVVSQSVRDAYFAMDSVFLGAAERQTAQLNFSGITLPRALEFETVPYQFPLGTSALFVSELLDWVDRAASEELPQVLQTSGKDGLPALKSVIDNLRHFLRASIVPPQKSHGLPPGYRTPRVQRTMLELADALDETYKLAFDIKAPRLPVFGNKHPKQIP